MQFNALFSNPFFMFFLVLWSLVWKGLALWRAARHEQRNWFIALLVISTMGILEIAYLFYFARKRLTLKEIKGWVNK